MNRNLRATLIAVLLVVGLVACQPKKTGVTVTPTTATATTVALQPVPTLPAADTTLPPYTPKTYFPPSNGATPVTPVTPVIPAGAMAQCRDGSISYSANHSGTCSHHGGVAVWYR